MSSSPHKPPCSTTLEDELAALESQLDGTKKKRRKAGDEQARKDDRNTGQDKPSDTTDQTQSRKSR